MNVNTVFILILASFVLINAIYFIVIEILSNKYHKTIGKYIWLIDFGFIILFGVLIALIVFFDSKMKNSFVNNHNYLFPIIIIICVFALIMFNYFFEKKIKKTEGLIKI